MTDFLTTLIHNPEQLATDVQQQYTTLISTTSFHAFRKGEQTPPSPGDPSSSNPVYDSSHFPCFTIMALFPPYLSSRLYRHILTFLILSIRNNDRNQPVPKDASTREAPGPWMEFAAMLLAAYVFAPVSLPHATLQKGSILEMDPDLTLKLLEDLFGSMRVYHHPTLEGKSVLPMDNSSANADGPVALSPSSVSSDPPNGNDAPPPDLLSKYITEAEEQLRFEFHLAQEASQDGSCSCRFDTVPDSSKAQVAESALLMVFILAVCAEEDHKLHERLCISLYSTGWLRNLHTSLHNLPDSSVHSQLYSELFHSISLSITSTLLARMNLTRQPFSFRDLMQKLPPRIGLHPLLSCPTIRSTYTIQSAHFLRRCCDLYPKPEFV